MRVYIMTDMEGVCGLLDSENWCDSPTSKYYDQGKDLLTREVNAAVEGFLGGGATEILVADGHGCGGINPSILHPAAELACHWPKGKAHPFSMDAKKFDFAAWVGQHPKAGTTGGHLCHTGSFHVREESVNGISIGEFGELALCAGELGTRVIFASGCEAFAREAETLVPGVETVAVKRGAQTDPGHNLPYRQYARHNIAAVHLSPEQARNRIRAGAERAIRRARKEDFGIITLAPPYTRRIVLRSSETEPPRVSVSEHAESIIELMREPGKITPLEIDPLEYVERRQ